MVAVPAMHEHGAGIRARDHRVDPVHDVSFERELGSLAGNVSERVLLARNAVGTLNLLSAAKTFGVAIDGETESRFTQAFQGFLSLEALSRPHRRRDRAGLESQF